MKFQLALALLSALAIPGCMYDLGSSGGDEPLPWAPEPDPWVDGREGSLTVTNPSLEGRVGFVTAGADSYIASAYGGEGYVNVDIRSRSGAGVIMNGLNIEGELEVGRTYQTRGWEPDGDVYLSVIGCSGPEDNVWDVDLPADEVTVTVEEGPEEGTVEIFYTAQFDGREATRGSFTMAN